MCVNCVSYRPRPPPWRPPLPTWRRPTRRSRRPSIPRCCGPICGRCCAPGSLSSAEKRAVLQQLVDPQRGITVSPDLQVVAHLLLPTPGVSSRKGPPCLISKFRNEDESQSGEHDLPVHDPPSSPNDFGIRMPSGANQTRAANAPPVPRNGMREQGQRYLARLRWQAPFGWPRGRTMTAVNRPWTHGSVGSRASSANAVVDRSTGQAILHHGR